MDNKMSFPGSVQAGSSKLGAQGSQIARAGNRPLQSYSQDLFSVFPNFEQTLKANTPSHKPNSAPQYQTQALQKNGYDSSQGVKGGQPERTQKTDQKLSEPVDQGQRTEKKPEPSSQAKEDEKKARASSEQTSDRHPINEQSDTVKADVKALVDEHGEAQMSLAGDTELFESEFEMEQAPALNFESGSEEPQNDSGDDRVIDTTVSADIPPEAVVLNNAAEQELPVSTRLNEESTADLANPIVEETLSEEEEDQTVSEAPEVLQQNTFDETRPFDQEQSSDFQQALKHQYGAARSTENPKSADVPPSFSSQQKSAQSDQAQLFNTELKNEKHTLLNNTLSVEQPVEKQAKTVLPNFDSTATMPGWQSQMARNDNATAMGLQVRGSDLGLNATSVPASVSKIHTPFQQAAWMEMMHARVKWMVQSQVQSATIYIDPPELGPVHISIHHSSEQTQVNFQVQNAQVREALEQHAHRLRDAMAGQGQLDVNVNVRDQNQQQTGRDGSASASAAGQSTITDGDIQEGVDEALESPTLSSTMPDLVNTYV